MMYANSRQEALKERKKFEQAFRHNPKAGQAPIEEKDWEYLWADGIYVKAGKGKTGEVQFTPEQAGDFVGHCSVFCGMGHGSMHLTLRVVE